MLSAILKTSLSYFAKNINFDLFFNKLERLMAINKRHEMYVMLCAILKTRLSYSAKNINFDLFPSKLECFIAINKRHTHNLTPGNFGADWAATQIVPLDKEALH